MIASRGSALSVESGWSVPSKVLLIGEYLALAGGPAIVCSLAARRFELVPDPSARSAPWHVASPAGQLYPPETRGGWRLIDPWEGAGGFGRSSAEYVLARALAGQHGDAGWDEFRRVTGGLASGVDVLGQWHGGAISVRFAPTSNAPPTIKKQPSSSAASAAAAATLHVFAAAHLPGRKVATHEHLSDIARRLGGVTRPETWRTLQPWAEAFERSWVASTASAATQLAELGRAVDGYAEALAALGLTHAATRELILQARSLPGVVGAKGVGALGADAIVLVAPPDQREAIATWARARGLIPAGPLDPSAPGLSARGGPPAGARP